MKRFFSLIVLSLASVVSFSCIDDENNASNGDILIDGNKLPEFSVVTMDGNEVSTSALKGMPCVIVFFNTGCGDCRRELPVVNRVYEEYGEWVNFLCIAREESAVTIKEFWEAKGLALPVAPQADRSVYNLFAERGIPRVYVCDADGLIVTMFTERVGYKKLRKAVESVRFSEPTRYIPPLWTDATVQD